MIIYQVQVKIDKNIKDEWTNWMISKHIPDVLLTGFFLSANLFQVSEDGERNTFIVQYLPKSIDALNVYREKFSPALQKEHYDKFKDKFTASRSVLNLIKSFEYDNI